MSVSHQPSDTVPRMLQQALSYYQAGKPLEAETACQKILAIDSGNAQALHLMGIICLSTGRHEAAAGFFERAIGIKKNDPLFYYHLGLALQNLKKLDAALAKFSKAAALKPDYADAHIKSADIFKEQGKFHEAELALKRVIALDPHNAALYHNIGWILDKQGKVDEAALMYQKSISLNPYLPEPYNNLGIIFNARKNFDEAEKMYRQAIALRPGYAEAHHNLGDVLSEKKPDEAAQHYVQAITHNPYLVQPYINLGKVFRKLGLVNEAIALHEQALALHPDHAQLLTRLVDYIYNACAWDKLGDYEAQLLKMVREKRGDISPFTVLCLPSSTAEDQLICARAYDGGKEQPPQAQFKHKPRKSLAGKTDGRIKIGYLSSDFQEHATAYLMAELFERHDRARFHITAYSYGPDDNSDMRKRLVKAFDSFIDLSNLSDHAAAQKIYDDGVDILIDLKGGATKDARIGILGYRPAPVQVNYIGYPGTTGVNFIDYIIADRFIIPEDQQHFYSEKVICLPDCYQPNDTHRKIAETVPTRTACGLPEQGFVFCSFNGSYKITPQVFDIWMRLLQKVPGSVLWLLEVNLAVKAHLRQQAERRGVDPDRMIFSYRVPLPEHLARHRLADLFLDTLPVNAHTTTSDALWAGLPVLTCAGRTFASRVAGSLLTAAGLAELITYSLEDYEALALKLAQNPAQLAEIRQKIERTRLQMPLFDIERFTGNLEKSYQRMWDIWQAGNGPKPFTV